MPPRFQTCPLCGRGFGSASIDIHIPQCYDKAIKRWRLNPTGPAPVLPQVQSRGAGKARGSAATMSEDMPMCLTSSRAGGNGSIQPTEYAAPSANPNLHPCRKCGRSFNYDRIAKHESVCKGDQKRRKFDSRNQRLASLVEEDNVGFGRPPPSVGKRGPRGRGGAALSMNAGGGGSNTYTSPRGKNSNWRQQHEEFISAIRAARRDQQLDSQGMGMWSVKPSQQQQQQRAAPGFSGSRFASGSVAAASGKPDQSSARFGRVPPQVLTQKRIQGQQRLSHAQSAGIGAGAVRSAAPMSAVNGARSAGNFPESQAPVKPGFGSRLPRFSGHDVGGGGGKIVNTNTTSMGMLQAFGRA